MEFLDLHPVIDSRRSIIQLSLRLVVCLHIRLRTHTSDASSTSMGAGAATGAFDVVADVSLPGEVAACGSVDVAVILNVSMSQYRFQLAGGVTNTMCGSVLEWGRAAPPMYLRRGVRTRRKPAWPSTALLLAYES